MSNLTPVCYFPKGNVANGHSPCNASAAESWCCAAKDYCLSNGFCLQASDVHANRIGRGSCTDQEWNSPACPRECVDGEYHMLHNPFARSVLSKEGVRLTERRLIYSPQRYPRLRSLAGFRGR